MTRKKQSDSGPYSTLELSQFRLRLIARNLEHGNNLSDEERAFLVDALLKIGAGADANAVLEVQAKRRQRKTSKQAAKADRKRFALAFIASAIRPRSEGGSGLSLCEAIERAAENKPGEANFGLSEDSLRTLWHSHPELQKPNFAAPIFWLPIPSEEK